MVSSQTLPELSSNFNFLDTNLNGFRLCGWIARTMSILHVRVAVRNRLGFETFIPDSVDSQSLQYAFLIPRETPRALAENVRDFLQTCFMSAGYRVCTVSWIDGGDYDKIYLESHWLFEVIPDADITCEISTKPQIGPWVLAEVHYDSFLPEESPTRFETKHIAATTPENFQETYSRIRTTVRDIVCCSLTGVSAEDYEECKESMPFE